MLEPVLSPNEAKQLIAEVEERSKALEAAQYEMNILYKASTNFAHAYTPEELLEAVSEYARGNGAMRGLMVYSDYEDDIRVDTIVAEWIQDKFVPLGIGQQFRFLPEDIMPVQEPYEQKPYFISNVCEDEQIHPIYAHDMCSVVHLAFCSKGRQLAGVSFHWDYPRDFDSRDERIYAILQQQMTVVIDSVRLFEGLQKRAMELELANNDLNLLYKTSELINSANTYQEVVEAVAQFDLEADVVTLMLWDTWDWKTAEYLDVPVVIDRRNSGLLPAGSRLPQESFPIAKVMMGQRVWLFEDGKTDPRIDPVTAESWAALNIRSFMGPALYIKKCWIGGITFHSSVPRKYSQREERLLAGVGDLVLAAIVRIRLQNETEVSRQHAEALANTNAELLKQAQQRTIELEAANAEIDLMYHIGEGINSANTYAELVQSLSGIIEGANSVALFFWEDQNYETANYVEQIAATGYLLSYVGHRVPKEILAYADGNRAERLMIFEDVATDSRLNNDTISHYLARELQAAISIRLYIHNRWIGALVFNNNVPHVFSEKDRRLAAGVGDYVLGAVERIRLQDEKEKAKQRAEMLGKVNSLLSQARDDQSILNAVAELFQNLGVAWFGLAYSLNQFESDDIFAKYVATIPQTEAAYPYGNFSLNDYPCLNTAYILAEKPIFVENVETDQRPEFRYLLTKPETEKWKAVVILPLQTGNDWQGLMSFYWYTPQTFSQEIRDIFTAIMPNVASIVAIRKAYRDEQEARHENELLYKASKGINNAATVAEIVTALDQLNLTNLHINLTVWENYDRESASHLEFVAGSASSSWQTGEQLSIAEFPIASATAHQFLVMVDSTDNMQQIDRQSAQTIEARGYRAFMMVHLLLVHHCIGILMFSSRTSRTFSAHEKRLAAGIGELVTAAVERLRLHAESETARQEAERHAQQAQKLASLEERTRLARELHDSVSQVLYGIGLGARTARTIAKQDPAMLQEPLDYILSLAEAGLTEMRALIFELRPESLEQEGLITTLKKQSLSLSARYNIHVETEFCDEPDLMFDAKESLYRIAREALHNTVKHAQASAVRLALLRNESGYLLEIQDNGIGFDVEGTFTGHLGLKSMRERTDALNGVLNVLSASGKGTKITVQLPLSS